MRNIFLIKLRNIIIEKYQIIQYCSKMTEYTKKVPCEKKLSVLKKSRQKISVLLWYAISCDLSSAHCTTVLSTRLWPWWKATSSPANNKKAISVRLGSHTKVESRPEIAYQSSTKISFQNLPPPPDSLESSPNPSSRGKKESRVRKIPDSFLH